MLMLEKVSISLSLLLMETMARNIHNKAEGRGRTEGKSHREKQVRNANVRESQHFSLSTINGNDG
jgi:hypothetical protein